MMLVLASAGAGCSDDRRALSPDDLPGRPVAVIEVTVSDGGFATPTDDTVRVGDSIAITVAGGPVTVRSDDLPLDTGPLLDGESVLVAFDEPGRFAFTTTADGTPLTIDVDR